MTSSDLLQIFRKEVPRPTNVQGDPYGIDATTEEILRVMNAPPESHTADDFLGYLGYRTTGGDDDFRYLLPSILTIWEDELYERDNWFTQYFHEEVSRTDFIERALKPQLKRAVLDFMIRALSERIASEESLSINGSSTTHNWFRFLASFGVYTTEISTLWSRVWNSEELGHAVAVLQYISCLLFEEPNPVFAPWTCKKGGGPPSLWELDSVGFGEYWKTANLDFLSSALSSGSIREWLITTSHRHSNAEAGKVAASFLDHLDTVVKDVDLRIHLLQNALQTPSSADFVTWDSLLDASPDSE